MGNIHHFTVLDADNLNDLPLAIYVDRLIDVTGRFFTDYPGYHAIFMQVQGTISELEELEHAADVRLVQNLAASLSLLPQVFSEKVIFHSSSSID